jgi:hypothetical protein
MAAPHAAVRVALEVPTAAAMAATKWPSARHYLPLEPVQYDADMRHDVDMLHKQAFKGNSTGNNAGTVLDLYTLTSIIAWLLERHGCLLHGWIARLEAST